MGVLCFPLSLSLYKKIANGFLIDGSGIMMISKETTAEITDILT